MHIQSKLELQDVRLEHIHMRLDYAPPVFGRHQDDQWLIGSIDELGMLAPLVVMRETDDCYRIVDGHRRYLAASQLAFDSVFCWIVPKRLNRGEYELLRFQLYSSTKPLSKAERQNRLERLNSHDE